jgi:hypothetical protein
MRFVCGDVRDLIVSHKNDHGYSSCSTTTRLRNVPCAYLFTVLGGCIRPSEILHHEIWLKVTTGHLTHIKPAFESTVALYDICMTNASTR